MDALIPREDFEVHTPEPVTEPSILSTTMKITDLGPESLIYNVLRKPDFQRETANWTPEKVAELVRSFLEGDLIPSVILWRSPRSGNIFVIDGAHRLSALVAWVHDDYGDKHTSMRFFDNTIPVEQKRAADGARKIINDSVGSYAELSSVLRNPGTSDKSKLRLARNLSAFALHLQWVVGGAEKAESSFFRINQQATPIDQTELDMIKARRKPNALAARAFIRAGTGHKYWSDFEVDTQEEIERIAKEVYELMFRPALETSIRTTDLPAAGRGYSSDSLRMVFELVNFVNNLTPDMWQRPAKAPGQRAKEGVASPLLADDGDGSRTIEFMRAVRKAASRIAGNEPGSLGLHPAVYFYSATGRFQPAAFLATVALVVELEKKKRIAAFTDVRAAFEEFLVTRKYFLNQIVRNYGSMQRAVGPIHVMHRTVFDCLTRQLAGDEIVVDLKRQPSLRASLKEITDDDRQHGRNFSTETKNMIVLRGVLEGATRCGICGARVPLGSASIDHRLRKADGGTGMPENGQIAHPYCNTGYKESRHAQQRGSQAALFAMEDNG
ncbi:HNH endonuclease family protein [Micromonospora endophytica]|nr:DUF262 domain-containing protein [Micromonospora endophytica]